MLEAQGAAATTLTRHVERAPGDDEPARALQRMAAEVATVPAVAADLLGLAADLAVDDPATRDAITVQRAGRWPRPGSGCRRRGRRATAWPVPAT